VKTGQDYTFDPVMSNGSVYVVFVVHGLVRTDYIGLFFFGGRNRTVLHMHHCYVVLFWNISDSTLPKFTENFLGTQDLRLFFKG
jgi:hypothetical protein